MNHETDTPNSGFAIIEVLISMVVALAVLGVLGTTMAMATKMNRMNRYNLQGTLYTRELIEIAKDLEGSDWGMFDICTDTTNGCRPIISGVAPNERWGLVNGEQQTIDIYTRSLFVRPVRRDANCAIFDAGNVDPNTKHIEATTKWYNGFFEQTATLETFVYKFPPICP